MVVYAHYRSEIHLAACGRGNYDLFHGLAHVRRRSLAGSENTACLRHDLRSRVGPRNIRRVSLRKHLYGFSVNGYSLVVVLYLSRVATEHRIILEKMGQGFCIGNIVYAHELKVFSTKTNSKCVPSYPPEPIYSNPDRHRKTSET